jgi:hypothetical protein
MKWHEVNIKKPENRSVIRVETIAGGYCVTGYGEGHFDYDLECEEMVSIVGMGSPDRVKAWRHLRKNSTAYKNYCLNRAMEQQS